MGDRSEKGCVPRKLGKSKCDGELLNYVPLRMTFYLRKLTRHNAGTFASWWQSAYAGLVPKRSLFSFFQRLGMVKWHWVLV
jgi:hypothetical protein